MNFDIDIAIFIGFLIINLVVGLSYGSGVKTINDYALGGRNFSTAALVSTIVATFITGSGFFVTLSKTYSDGLPFVIASCCMALQFFITGIFIIPRMAEFMGSLSIAEVMGNLYGKHVRLITAVSAIIWNVGGIAVQFKVFGTLFNYFLGIPSTLAIILASTIVILYSAFGGIRAVTYTDILQFFTFGFVIPTIAIIIWNQFQSMGLTLTGALQNPIFDYQELFNLRGYELIDFILLILYFSVPNVGPIHFQRISMGKNVNQARKAWLIAAILLVLVKLTIAWIPFLILSINPSLEPNQITSYLINNYTNLPLMKGLIIIGVSAMAMSSADSFINGSAVLFGHDIKEVLKIKINNLFLSKVFSLVLGIFAIYLALSTNDLLEMVMTAASFYLPVVTVPLIFAILGFRSTTKAVLIAMSAGFITVVLWKILNIKLNSIIFAMLANLIALMGSHYLLKQPGGWVGIKDREYLDQLKNRNNNKIAKLMATITNFNFIEFCKKTSPKNELAYMWLGIYCILYTFTTMYSTQVELTKDNGKIILTIYQIMMVTSVIMAMYPIWPTRIKHEIIVQVAWNIVIFYMLIFFTCFFVMVSHFGQLQFAVFTINMLIAAILTGWRLGLSMALIGVYASIQFYKYYTGLDEIDSNIGSSQFIFLYTLMFAGSALIIFFKPRQEYIEATEQEVGVLKTEVTNLDHEVTNLNQHATHLSQEVVHLNKKATNLNNEVTNLNKTVGHYRQRVADQQQEIERLGKTAQKILNNVNHELRLPIGNVINFSDMLWETLQKSDNKLLQELSKEVYKNSNRVSSMILNMLDLATLDVKKMDLQKETINFSKLVEERVQACHKIYLGNKKIDFDLKIQPDMMIAVDPNYMRQTVDNLVINAISFSETGIIKVSVTKRDGQVIFTITDQGKGIPPLELEDIFTPFKMGSNTESKADGRGIGLALCKSAVEAHGGKIKAESDGKVGATVSFVLPL